ncbi:hypothetical protein A3D81_02205 [Candidatus Curtissbacteria bacterium RIFCSPHIGHO2_02_FULL_40_17]|uniref:Uncharacterized protein n=2 Tax=Candidatus Curtissiibacteriota TaxID=1752717 RepID=A0A1F5GH09_9BACT|nr:MAG: hypothetical protein A3D81_02205 [Candidatus Curtissbacteria bacterium RIFCSPHIGHO2_02_FULL_40_17]OGE05509.1 MAG: hypothetical protein A3F45_03990 [Candidatus Curtissbacteria bacterium RIFCSPHIGHO2_12_FULL_41_17]
MLQNTNSTFVAIAIGTLGLASIIGSYKLVKMENVSTAYLAEARQTSVVNNYKVSSNQSPENLPKGFVTGKLCYPGDFLPEGKIAAKNIDSGTIYTLYYPGSKNGARSSYYFVLITGKYKLRYETFIGTNQIKPFSGYYKGNSQVVEVENGKTIKNIDLCDFYNSANDEPDF